MRVKVSKNFASEIAKYIKSVCKDEHEVQVENHGEGWYRMNMPLMSHLEPENDQDYDIEANVYKVIAIYRPYEYYACPVYLSSHMILQAYRKLSEKTLQALMQQIWTDYIEC